MIYCPLSLSKAWTVIMMEPCLHVQCLWPGSALAQESDRTSNLISGHSQCPTKDIHTVLPAGLATTKPFLVCLLFFLSQSFVSSEYFIQWVTQHVDFVSIFSQYHVWGRWCGFLKSPPGLLVFPCSPVSECLSLRTSVQSGGTGCPQVYWGIG